MEAKFYFGRINHKQLDYLVNVIENRFGIKKDFSTDEKALDWYEATRDALFATNIDLARSFDNLSELIENGIPFIVEQHEDSLAVVSDGIVDWGIVKEHYKDNMGDLEIPLFSYLSPRYSNRGVNYSVLEILESIIDEDTLEKDIFEFAKAMYPNTFVKMPDGKLVKTTE